MDKVSEAVSERSPTMTAPDDLLARFEERVHFRFAENSTRRIVLALVAEVRARRSGAHHSEVDRCRAETDAALKEQG